MGDPFAFGELDDGIAQIDQNHSNFSAIIAIDGAGGVHHAQSESQGEAGSRADLPLESFGNRHLKSGADELTLQGVQVDVFERAQIESGGSIGGVRGEFGAWFSSDSEFRSHVGV